MELINKYLIYVDLSLAVLLVIFVLKGLISGTKKMLVTSVLKWGLILLLVLFSGQIADVLLQTVKIEGKILNVYLLEKLATAMKLDITPGGYVETLIYALIKAVTSMLIVYLSVAIVTIVVYPVVSIILAICGVRQKANDGKKTLASRGVGMILGVLVTIVIFITCYMPIYGSVSLAKTIETDVNQMSKKDNGPSESLAIELPEENNSYVMKYLAKSEYNVFEKYIDNYFVVSMNGTKVKMIKEYYNIRTLIPIITKYTNAEKGSYKGISSEEFSTIINFLTGTNLKEIIIPVGLEVCISKGTFEKNEIEITEDDIKDTDWKKEIGYFDDFLESLIDTYNLYKKYENNPKDILGDEEFVQVVTKNFEELLNMYIINNYGVDLLNKALEKEAEKTEDTKVKEILNIIEFKDNLIDDVRIICSTIYDIYHLGFINKDVKPDYNSTKTQDVIKDLFNGVFSLSFIKGNEQKILDIFYTMFTFDKYLDRSTISLDKVNWENEPTALANIVIEYTKLLGENKISKFDVNLICGENNKELINAICESDLIVYGIVPVMNSMLKEKITTTNFGELADIIDIKSDKKLLKNDITIVLEILPTIKDTENLSDILNDEDKTQTLLVNMFNLSFVKGNEQTLIEKLITTFSLNEFLEAYGITLDYNVSDWSLEAKKIGTFLYQANKIGIDGLTTSLTNINDENKEDIKHLLYAISESQLIQKALPQMIDKTLTDEGLEDWKSSWLVSQKTTFTKELWKPEIDNLIDVLQMYQTNNIDFGNIKTEDLENVRNVLYKMSEIRSIKMGYMLSIINDELKEQTGTTEIYLTEPTNMDWKKEIDLLFARGGIYEMVTSIDDTTTYREYGRILDKVKELQSLGSNYYGFILDYVNNLPACKDGSINLDLTEENLRAVTSFEEELAIIDSIDFNATTQSGELIDQIMKSKLFRPQTISYIEEIIIANNLEEYYDTNDIATDIDVVNARIASSKEDSDETNDWSWTKEIEVIESFNDKLNETISNPTEANALELKTIAEQGTITTKALENVKTKYPIIAGLL